MSEVVYQFKITLRGTKPAIWRRIQVPGHATFKKFHEILQATMGWWDGHLHEFEVGNYRLFDPEVVDDFGDGEEGLDERKVRLSEILGSEGRVKKLLYTYDFGDGWRHDIVLEEIVVKDLKFATCLAGKRKCPPEDVGGLGGFYNFLEIIESPTHPEHQEMKEWYDRPFDPADFDPGEVDAKLRDIRLARPRAARPLVKSRMNQPRCSSMEVAHQ